MDDALQQFLKGQGWSFFGVVSSASLYDAFRRHEAVFESWEKQGFAAGMDYLKKMQPDRFHPENKLPDIKSVVVLGAWYASAGRPLYSTDAGRVARYAVGRDYHNVLKKKLKQFADWLALQAKDARATVSVDSGPTVDRVLAEAAGLGFFGKNSCIINPGKGSYFFIASVMATLALTPTPVRRMPNCGSCNRCSVACPTGAIVAPGVIDARRCISYLTIENKDGIPPELRPKIGNHLFGCDICQEVCPFNVGRAGRQTVLIPELHAENGAGDSLSLRAVFSLENDEQFTARFAGTPLMRAKRRGLLRNACVVAGNSGDRSLIPDLEKIMARENDPMLREHAAWALERLSSTNPPA